MRFTFVMILFSAVILVNVANAQVQVTLPDTTANWNSQILIPIRVTDVSAYEIYSYQFELKFDSLILKLVNVSYQNTLTATWAEPVMNTGADGTVIIGGYGTNKLAGRGTLINLRFDVIGNPDQVSNLNLSSFLFNSGNPTAATVNGRVKVVTNLISVTITTNVLNGTNVLVDGTTHSAPYTTYWEKGASHEISAPSPQNAGSNKRYAFQSWSDQEAQTHTVSVTAPTTFTANYNSQFYLNLQSSHGNPKGTGWYNAGAVAQFSVESPVIEGGNSQYTFTSWTGSGTGSYSGTQRESSVVMNNPITQMANWSVLYYLEVNSPYGKPFGQGWYAPGSVVNFGIDSTTINRSNAHYRFLSWTGTGAGSYSGTNSGSTISVSEPIKEQASWDAEFLVETGSDPAGILSVPGGGWYRQGGQFTTIKAPDNLVVNQFSYKFKGWKVNDQIVAGNPLTLVINEPKKIIADYSTDISVVITTSVGLGTKVIVDGEEKPAPYTAQWIAGAKHSIGIVSAQNGTPGARFSYQRWNNGGNQIQDVTPMANTNYIAELKTEYYLEVKDQPAGLVNPEGSNWYAAMQIVKLDSIPQGKLKSPTSYRFIKWQVDGIDSTNRSISILMDKPHSAIAIYQSGFYISGTITFVGVAPTPVVINVSGKETFSLTGSADGSYLIPGLLSGNYEISLSQPNYRFEPPTRSYSISANELYQYFVAFSNPNSVVTEPQSGGIPMHYELFQNYPNPFSDLTMIEYQVKQDEMISLTVYNVLGQLIKRLVATNQIAGRYQVEWDRTNQPGIQVPPGVYFYQIETSQFKQIKKMIVL
ncbi:MAG TPA: cohesin domain-containing protein [bacterium]